MFLQNIGICLQVHVEKSQEDQHQQETNLLAQKQPFLHRLENKIPDVTFVHTFVTCHHQILNCVTESTG